MLITFHLNEIAYALSSLTIFISATVGNAKNLKFEFYSPNMNREIPNGKVCGKVFKQSRNT